MARGRTRYAETGGLMQGRFVRGVEGNYLVCQGPAEVFWDKERAPQCNPALWELPASGGDGGGGGFPALAV